MLTTFFALSPAHDGQAWTPHHSFLTLTLDQMEDYRKTTGSASVSDVTQPRHRYSVPDVPEDVEDVMQHFNDPNWDFHQANASTLSISTDGVEHKRWSKSSTFMGAGSSEMDTEFQDSKADFSSEATQVESALLSIFSVSFHSLCFYQGFTVS